MGDMEENVTKAWVWKGNNVTLYLTKRKNNVI